jgi:hypothetical protein
LMTSTVPSPNWCRGRLQDRQASQILRSSQRERSLLLASSPYLRRAYARVTFRSPGGSF